ncbi:dethiobiotin synthase [Helicobacter sp.]|uniref:dethiobiotin synthase n=1 Tax=Helicobacter sp. TaxID=218 RepID=UPI0025C4F8D9|nr:dethiobiotin synthase [Helicobacter sp.]MCI5968869.1 dethiobiotin synthase [Helicobacter sp.]MDY2585054.1 dethiobiotin synthase [Helicobacter sp.]
MKIFIAGSHTDVGKTAVSAALCYAFNLEYFKLVQAGIPQDCERIKTLSPKTKIHPNGITLQTPASPHIAMKKEGVFYRGLEIPLPQARNLLVESAGGLFTPLDLKMCMIDYLEASKLPCVLVGGYYLGGINHILLSLQALKARRIALLCLVISGEQNLEMDSFLQNYAQVRIAHFEIFNNTQSFRENALALKQEIQTFKIL